MTHSVTCFKSSGFPLLPEITIKNEQSQVVVRKVPEGGQFANNGVKEGDIIVSVNGVSFKGFDNNKVFTTLSVITGEVTIVFSTPGTSAADLSDKTDGKFKRKTRSGVKPDKDVVEEAADPKPNVPPKKEAEPPKLSTKMNRKGIKSILQDKNTTLTLKSRDTPKEREMAVNQLESILDNSKRKNRNYRPKQKVETVVNKSVDSDKSTKDEASTTANTAIEECPECDETFNGIEPLSEHYKKAHTVENDDEEVQEISVTPDVVDLPEEKEISAKVARKLLKEVDAKSVKEMGDNNDLKKQLQIITDKYAVAEKENSKKNEQIIKLNEGMELIKEKFANLKKERMELKKKSEINSELETSLRTLKDEVDVKYQEMFDLKRVVLKTEEHLDMERKGNQKEKDRNKVLTEEIKKLKKALNELNKKHKESEDRNKKEKEKSANQQQDQVKVNELEKEVETLQTKISQLTSENESLVEETLEMSKKEKEVLQNVIDEKIVEVEELKSEKSLSKMKIRDLEKQMDAFKANAEDITAKISEIDNERENDRNSLISTMGAQKKKIDELVKEKDSHKERANKYKSDVTKLLEKITRKEDKIDELKKKAVTDEELKKEQMDKKLKSFQDTILQKSGIITKLEDENQKLLKEKIENLPLVEEKKKSRNLEEQLRKVERQNRELAEKFRSIEIENENKSIQNRIEYTQDVIKTNELSNKLEELTEESIKREAKIKELLGEKEKLEQSLKENAMEAEEKNLLNLLKSEVRTMESANEVNVEKIISLEMEIDSYKNGEKSHEVVKLKTDFGELERDLSELKVRYKVLDDENREHLNDLSESLKSLVHLKDKYSKLKMKSKGMETEFDTLNKENISLKGEVSHMSQLQVEMKTLKHKLEETTEPPPPPAKVIKTEHAGSASDSSDEEEGLFIAESSTPKNKSRWGEESSESSTPKNKSRWGEESSESSTPKNKSRWEEDSSDEEDIEQKGFFIRASKEEIKKEEKNEDIMPKSERKEKKEALNKSERKEEDEKESTPKKSKIKEKYESHDEISDIENEFDTSKFIEHCKEKVVKTEKQSDALDNSNKDYSKGVIVKKEPSSEELTKAEKIAIRNDARNMDDDLLRRTFGDILVDKFSLQKKVSDAALFRGYKKRRDNRDNRSRSGSSGSNERFDTKKSFKEEKSFNNDNRDIDIREETNGRRNDRRNGGRRDFGRNNRNFSDRNRRFGGDRHRGDQDNDRDVRVKGTWSNNVENKRRKSPDNDSRKRKSSKRDSSVEEKLKELASVENKLKELATERILKESSQNKSGRNKKQNRNQKQPSSLDEIRNQKPSSLDNFLKLKYPTAVIPAERKTNNKGSIKLDRQRDLREQLLSYREFHKKGLSREVTNRDYKPNTDLKKLMDIETKEPEPNFNMGNWEAIEPKNNLNIDVASTSSASTSKFNTRDVPAKRNVDPEKTAKILAEVQAKINQASNPTTKFEERNVHLTEKDDFDDCSDEKKETEDEKQETEDQPIDEDIRVEEDSRDHNKSNSDLEEGELSIDMESPDSSAKTANDNQLFRKPTIPKFKLNRTTVLSNLISGRSA